MKKNLCLLTLWLLILGAVSCNRISTKDAAEDSDSITNTDNDTITDSDTGSSTGSEFDSDTYLDSDTVTDTDSGASMQDTDSLIDDRDSSTNDTEVAIQGVIRSGAAQVTGPASKEAVRTVINENIKDEILDCYEQVLQTDSSITGRIAIQFSFDSEGVVNTVTISSSTIENEGLINCILPLFYAAAFPASTASNVVIYPFQLYPFEEPDTDTSTELL